MRLRIWLGASFGLALAASPAGAQLSQNWQWCVNDDNKYSLDLAINGCTAVIQAGRESQKNLAIAFYDRGNAYEDKRDYARASPISPRRSSSIRAMPTPSTIAATPTGT
jgi:hypothetical protein